MSYNDEQDALQSRKLQKIVFLVFVAFAVVLGPITYNVLGTQRFYSAIEGTENLINEAFADQDVHMSATCFDGLRRGFVRKGGSTGHYCNGDFQFQLDSDQPDANYSEQMARYQEYFSTNDWSEKDPEEQSTSSRVTYLERVRYEKKFLLGTECISTSSIFEIPRSNASVAASENKHPTQTSFSVYGECTFKEATSLVNIWDKIL